MYLITGLSATRVRCKSNMTIHDIKYWRYIKSSYNLRIKKNIDIWFDVHCFLKMTKVNFYNI